VRSYLKRLRAETDERVNPINISQFYSNHGISYEKASDICGLSLSQVMFGSGMECGKDIRLKD